MAITKDLVVDYGADPTGSVDAQPKLFLFKTDMAGVDATLNVPAGSYKLASSGGQQWATGMTSLVVNATGATMFESPGGGPTLGSKNFTVIGIDEATGKSARIQSVAAGATSVSLTTTGLPGGTGSAGAGYISRAVVGQWMLVCGYTIQGGLQSSFGWPNNLHFLDYVQITGIVGNTISFTPALTNSYSSAWPEFFRGDASNGDVGGPASVFFLHPDFGATKVYNNLTVTGSNLVRCEGLDFTMNGGASTNFPIYPSANKIWRSIGHDMGSAAQVEADKLVDQVIVNGGTQHQWFFQSSSINSFSLSNATFDGSVNGTPRAAVIDTCVVAGGLNIGPTAYGRGDTLVCRNTSIAGTIGGGLLEGGFNSTVTDYMTMAGGVITIPMSVGDSGTRIFVPEASGRNVLHLIGNSGYNLGSFKVLSVTSDPWPALDNQSSTTNVTIANGSKSLTVSTSLFSPSDVGKVIFIPGAVTGGLSTLKTFITAYTSATQVTLFQPCTNASGLSAVSKTIQWGTSNIYVQTDQSGTWPVNAALYSTSLRLLAPPARTVSFENCTGSALAVDLSQAAARNRPLWSYTKRTYDGTNFGSQPNILLVGNIVSIKINVLTPYTGVQGTLTCGLSQNNNVKLNQGGSSVVDYAARVNLKIAGERVITIGSTTGAQTGDTNLNLSTTSWSCIGISPSVSADITGESSGVYPSFTIEAITDQGAFMGPTAVVPLRFRLHA